RRHERRQGHDRSGATVEAGARPDVSPRDAGDVVLEVLVVGVHVGDGPVDVRVAENLAADLHPLGAALVVGQAHDATSCRMRARASGASTAAWWATPGSTSRRPERADDTASSAASNGITASSAPATIVNGTDSDETAERRSVAPSSSTQSA